MTLEPEHNTATNLERIALGRRFNLSDGHARHTPTAEQFAVVNDMGELYRRASVESYDTLAAEFLDSFFALGRQDFQSFDPRPEFQYSASESIDIAAKTLRAVGVRTVGVVHPTFDNLADLMRRNGLELQPIRAERLWSEASDHLATVDALFVVAPNNPTGHEPTAVQFERLLFHCVQQRRPIVVDFSLRHFARNLHAWDQYDMAGHMPRLDALFIEDSGKTWPTQELKVGTLSASKRLQPVMRRISEELLLTVSPITLQLLRRLIDLDLRAESLGQETSARAVVRTNRTALRSALRKTPLRSQNPAATTSVEWLQLPATWDSNDLVRVLDSKGVALLPGGPLFWADEQSGNSFVRVALTRPPELVAEALPNLVEGVTEYAASLAASRNAQVNPLSL